MIPSGLYERYGLALDGAADAVTAAVEELFRRLEGLSGAEYARALDAGYRSLVALYGQAAAEAAVEFYAAVRSAQGVEGGFAPTAPQGAGQRGLSADVERALAAGDAAPAVLSGSAVKRTMERADGAIEANAARDPAKPRWARVPHAGACGWCVMIGSRGFAYLSKGKADAVRHANCRCRTVVDFERNPGLAGYDPERLYESYSECRAAVSGDAERAWAAMGDAERARYKGYSHYQRNRIISEMNSRDRNWLMTGEPPAVEFASESVEKGVREGRPHELAAAKRLSSHGVKCLFVDDRREYVDESSGLVKYAGLPDLAGGIELKSLLTAKSTSAVDRHLRDAGHKEGLAVCVIDNGEGTLADEAVGSAIAEKMGKRGVRNVLLIRSDGAMERFTGE